MRKAKTSSVKYYKASEMLLYLSSQEKFLKWNETQVANELPSVSLPHSQLRWPQVPVSQKGQERRRNEWVNERGEQQQSHTDVGSGSGKSEHGSCYSHSPIWDGLQEKPTVTAALPEPRNHGRTWRQDVWMEKGSDIWGVPEKVRGVTCEWGRRRWEGASGTHTHNDENIHSHTLTYTHSRALASSPPTSLRSLTLNRSESTWQISGFSESYASLTNHAHLFWYEIN